MNVCVWTPLGPTIRSLPHHDPIPKCITSCAREAWKPVSYLFCPYCGRPITLTQPETR